MQKIKERQIKLKQQLLERYNKKKKEKEKQEERQISGKLKATRDLEGVGWIWYVHDIETKLEAIAKDGKNEKHAEKLKRDAIMKQIRFHKTIVNARGPRCLFQETVNRISQTTDQLICNLKTILELNDGDSVEDTSVCTKI